MKKYTVNPKYTHKNRILVGDDGHGDDYVFLGRLAETGQLVRIDFDLYSPHIIAIFGKRGSGKSYTLGSFIEGLCTQNATSSISKTRKKYATLLFDTLGIFQWLNVPLDQKSTQNIIQEQALQQKGWEIKSEPLDAQIWAPKGTLTSQYQIEFTINCADFTGSDWGYLFGLDVLQDRMGQLINEAYEKVVNEGWSDGVSHFSPNKKYTIEEIMECIQKDPEIVDNYHVETRRAVYQQFSVYWRNPLFLPKRKIPSKLMQSTEHSTISSQESISNNFVEGTTLSTLLKPGMLSVLLLHKLSDELRLVVIMSLIRKIMKARIDASEIEKELIIRSDIPIEKRNEMLQMSVQQIPPTWIVADEAQNFLPSSGKTTATDMLIRLVREGRNFGLSFILTTQQPTAIDQRILSQVDSLIVHKLTVQGDIEYIKHNLKDALPVEIKYSEKILSFDDLLRTLDVGQAIISNTEASRIIIANIRPRVSVHGGFGVS